MQKKLPAIAALTATLFLTILEPKAHAVLNEETKNYQGARSAAMGGILTTTGNYSEALFGGNPARHTEVDASKISLLDISFESNSNLVQTKSDLSGVTSASGASTISNAAKLIGKNEHARVQLSAGYYNPEIVHDWGFAFGILTSTQANLLVNYTTDIDALVVVDAGPAMGISHKLLDGNLSIGLNLRALYRVATDNTISALSFLTGSKLSLQNFGKQGIGIDGDIGAYYHVPWEISFMRINAGLSLNNMMKSHYNEIPITVLHNVGPRPLNNDRLLNSGLRFDFPDTWILKAPLFAVEVQDIGDTTKSVSFGKRLHMGGETKLTKVVSFRAGLNQGYPTAGIGFDLPVLKIDLSTYGEELAADAGQLEDRRYILRLAFEL